jgi:hypothetical protein
MHGAPSSIPLNTTDRDHNIIQKILRKYNTDKPRQFIIKIKLLGKGRNASASRRRRPNILHRLN